jgi:large subunit ribosomal protein L2
MAIRSFKPTSPGRRFVTTSDFKELTTNRPEKKLTEGKKRSSGRNSEGHITSRHRGRGHKRRYRIIDFRRNKFDGPSSTTRTVRPTSPCCTTPTATSVTSWRRSGSR